MNFARWLAARCLIWFGGESRAHSMVATKCLISSSPLTVGSDTLAQKRFRRISGSRHRTTEDLYVSIFNRVLTCGNTLPALGLELHSRSQQHADNEPHHKFAASERPPNRPVQKPGGYRLTRCMAIISALTSRETSPTASPTMRSKAASVLKSCR